MKRALIGLATACAALILILADKSPTAVEAANGATRVDSTQTGIGMAGFGPSDRVLIRIGGTAYYTDGRVVGSFREVACRVDYPGVAGSVQNGVKDPFDWEVQFLPHCGPPATPPPPDSSCYYDYNGNYVCPPTPSYSPPPSSCYYDSAGNYVCPPPPSQPGSWSPAETSEWRYEANRTQNYCCYEVTIPISLGYNQMVVVTTGPASHRHWSLLGGVDRGTVIVFLGPLNESVYLRHGGWVGYYTAKTSVDSAWRSLLDAKIGDMRQSVNCSTGRGCRWIDTLVTRGGGTQIEFSNPRGPYYY